MQDQSNTPLVSIIILNYNGARWLRRCLESISLQTILQHLEIIIVDNASSDGSDELAQELIQGWTNACVLKNRENLGYCEGNNRGALIAKGKYLFFLNNDTWLEPDCMELLAAGVEACKAGAANPTVLDYENDNFQSQGASGFDFCGITDGIKPSAQTREIFAACGAAYFIDAGLFRMVGAFDREFFLYSDETDLSWRVWIAGQKVVAIPAAKVHHRSAAAVNPKGGTKVIESRTSYTKRFYASRNSLLFLSKNAQHVLLLLIVPYLILLCCEALVGLLLVRQWSFVQRVYIAALKDCWRLREHVFRERKRIKTFRKRNDFQMLRFLRIRPSRWAEVQQIWRRGLPIVDKA